MGFKKSFLTALLGVFTASLMASSAWAVNSGSYANQVPSARAMGRANTMVASVDDATAVTFNAARLPMVPANNLSVGVAFQDINTKYEGFNGVTDEADNNLAVTPNFHISSKLNQEKWGFGLGINVPWGLATNWTKSSPLKYLATETNLAVFNINPSVGYQINDSLSVGGGVDYYWVKDVTMKKQISGVVLNESIITGSATGTEQETQQKLTGDGAALGWDIGLAYKLMEKHLFGITFRRGAAVEVEGELEFNNINGTAATTVFGGPKYTTGAEATVYVPNQLMFGYAFKPTEKWVIEADAEWQEWSVSRDQNVKFDDPDPVRQAVLNADNPTLKDWHDAWSFGIGTEYILNKKWALRGGYSYLNQAVPETTFEPGLPDITVHILSLGAGYNITDDLAVDVAAQLFKTYKRRISNTQGDAIGAPIDGKYQSDGGFYGVNLRYTFGNKG